MPCWWQHWLKTVSFRIWNDHYRTVWSVLADHHCLVVHTSNLNTKASVILRTGERGKFFPLKLQLWTYSLRYFHKVPAEAPQLELKASYGLAEPVPFELPPLSEQCSAEVYATFDLTKGAKNDKVLQLTSKFFPTEAGWLFGNELNSSHLFLKLCCFITIIVTSTLGQTEGGGGETSEGARFEASEGHGLRRLLNIPQIPSSASVPSIVVMAFM